MDVLPRSTPYPERFEYARRMIFLGIVFVPFFTFALALAVSYVVFVDTFGSSAHDSLKRVVAERARNIETYVGERRGDLGFVLDSFSPESLSQSDVLDSLLERLRKKSIAFRELALVDTFGGVVAASRSRNFEEGVCETLAPAGGKTVADRFILDVHADELGVTRFAVVTVKADGPEPVALCATLDARAILQAVAEGGQNGAAEMSLRKAQARELPAEGPAGSFGMPPGFGTHSAAEGKAVSFVHEDEDGMKNLVAAVPLLEDPLVLVARQPVLDAFNDLFQVVWYIVAISLLGGVVTLSLASAISRRIGRALKEADEVRDLLRERLSRSTRLAELGEMTSGFAHEINNPLQVMESEITMMEMALHDFRDSGGGDAGTLERELQDNLEELQRQIRRCSTVTKSILTFGRQESVDGGATFPIGDVMRNVGAMVRKKAEIQSVDFRIDVQPETLGVSGDVGKVRQVFLNLLNNAVYAVVDKYSGRPGGRLDFSARQHGQGWVLVEVRDNGPGIPQAVLDNMYTPFFTTKPPQKGTGLGLAVCYGLIESMGGSIDVETRQGEGTVFRILLPAA